MENLNEMIKRLEEMGKTEQTKSNSDALKTAICAMKQQVGKKPGQRIHTYCPTCHCKLTRYSEYCPSCGQNLEWDERTIENINNSEGLGGTE